MVEIALCLAIIGFALVAIIGVLPTGLNVQTNNREETIINQDASVWLDAMRNGAMGYDDLVNYVIAITNYVWAYEVTATRTNQVPVGLTGAQVPVPNPEVNVFMRNARYRNGVEVTTTPNFWLDSGWHIIGILSRPRIEWVNPQRTGFYSNYIVANVRSMSGSVVDKFPQRNPVLLESAFSYRMVPEVFSYVPFYEGWTNYTAVPTNFESDFISRSNQWRIAGMLQTNLHDVRLLFRWPLLPNGDTGNGRQPFRLMVGGKLYRTNDFYSGLPDFPLYFFQPSTYAQAP